MKLIGLTGGIGMGKSVALEFLAHRGLPVVDTDVLARQAVEPVQPALDEIRSAFGNAIIAPDGGLLRAALAEIVFADESARKRLESILHPRIRTLWKNHVESWNRGSHPAAAVAIPLLFETRAQDDFDAVICAACSGPVQHQRLMNRGWNQEQISRRIQSQWPLTEKMARSNYILWTDGSMEAHKEQLDRILHSILL